MTSVSTAVYLLEIDVWNGSSLETWYVSTKTKSTQPSDSPGNTTYHGLILDAGQVDRTLNFSGGQVSASFSPASFRVDNLRNFFNAWINPDNAYALDGREFRLKQLESYSIPVSSATLIVKGTVRGIDASDVLHSLQILGTDQLALLDKPLLTAKYAGTTLSTGPTAEGDESMAGQIKPVLFGGPAINVTPKLANAFNLIYQVSILPVTSIIAYDGRLALSLTADFPNLATLIAAPLVVGQYATCLALGVFRVGGDPEKAITADVTQGVAGSRSASDVVQAMMSLFGVSTSVMDLTSFANFKTAYPAPVTIYIDSDATLLSLIGDVAGSVLGTVIPTDLGIYQAVWMSDPALGTPVDTYTLRDIGVDGSSFAYLLGANDDATGIPAWRVAVNYEKIWTVANGGDLLGDVGAAERARIANKLGYSQSSPAGAQSAAILTAHPLAVDLTVTTLLTAAADASAQAIVRFALVGRKRAKLITPINFDRASPAIGSVVRIRDTTHPLLAAGRNYLVLGRKDDMTKRIRYVKLWG
jgi:hypothetical protein